MKRKQIAAANWKMNLDYKQAEKLLDDVLNETLELEAHHRVIFAVPHPYLSLAINEVSDEAGIGVAAQNCHHEKSGAYTGEVSAGMLRSLGIEYCLVGHSERRQYFHENGEQLLGKIRRCLEEDIQPLFCCGEPLEIREAGKHLEHVTGQLKETLFLLSADEVEKIIIAYEPVWAIGTGKTATTEQAQDMHAHIREQLAGKFSTELAERIPILYGGSVKASNAAELFACRDVDGGLVGGASLSAAEFRAIIGALK